MTDQTTPNIDDQILNQGIEEEAASPTGKEPAKAAPEPKPGDETLELGGDEAPEATSEQIEAEAQRTRTRPWQKRVDILTARLREAERIAAEATARASGGTSAEAEAPKAPDPNDDKYEFGAADPDYIKDAALFEVKKQLAEERKGESEKAAEVGAKRAVVEHINEGMAAVEKAGTEKYEDFEAKIAEAVEARGGEPVHPLVGIGIAVSPVGADVAYALASDNAAAERIENLAKSDPLKAAQAFGELEGQFTDDDDDLNLADPLDMARALGRMRGRLKSGAVRQEKAAPEVKTTKAPKPPEHRSRGGSGNFDVSDDTDDFAAFERKHMRGSKG